MYLAAQNANPFGSLVALYIVAEDPVSGTLIKVAGEVKPDPVTGQLVSTFTEHSTTTVRRFEAALLRRVQGTAEQPRDCAGPTRRRRRIAPWSANAPAQPTSGFQITHRSGRESVREPVAVQPLDDRRHDEHSGWCVQPVHDDRSPAKTANEPIKSFQLHMPPGVSGLLTGVKLCGEAEADAGTCGPESLIGETIVSVGDGGNPFAVTGGKVYITGPYKGAPFGVSIVNPAKAGPYDFGRTWSSERTIQVDPITAALDRHNRRYGPIQDPNDPRWYPATDQAHQLDDHQTMVHVQPNQLQPDERDREP